MQTTVPQPESMSLSHAAVIIWYKRYQSSSFYMPSLQQASQIAINYSLPVPAHQNRSIMHWAPIESQLARTGCPFSSPATMGWTIQLPNLFQKSEYATRLQKVSGFIGLFYLRVQRLIFCSIWAEKVWMSVPSPLRPIIILSCILNTRWKSLASVSICLPNLRSAAIPTQSFPTMPTRVPPLYQKIDIYLKFIQIYYPISASLIYQHISYLQIHTDSNNTLLKQLQGMAELKRKYYSRSTINLKDSPEQQRNTQQNSFYPSSIQISQAMNDFASPVMRSEPKISSNIINNQKSHYQVPVSQGWDIKQNKSYLQYFQKYKVFCKPNGICSNYNEIIMKNRLLIRNTHAYPYKQNKSHLQKKKKDSNIKFRSFRHTEKQNRILNLESGFDQRSVLFDKTISNTQNVFNILLQKDRCKKSESILLTNSMSRLIDAQNIHKQLYPRTNNYIYAKE